MQPTFKLKEGSPDQWDLLIDNKKWHKVHGAIFGQKPVFPPFSLEEDLQSVFDAFEYRRVKSYVLRRLSSQSYHSQQLAKLLRDRLVQKKTIDRVLQEFRQKGFLDDDSWLEHFIGNRRKRYSLRLILMKLQAKGISPETIQRLEKEWRNPEEELKSIRHLLNTRYRTTNLAEYKSRQKVIFALVRKGYPLNQVRAAIQEGVALHFT